jgi:hypothetical protein
VLSDLVQVRVGRQATVECGMPCVPGLRARALCTSLNILCG